MNSELGFWQIVWPVCFAATFSLSWFIWKQRMVVRNLTTLQYVILYAMFIPVYGALALSSFIGLARLATLSWASGYAWLALVGLTGYLFLLSWGVVFVVLWKRAEKNL